MSRSRIGFVAAFVVAFVIVAGFVIYKNQSHGGQNVTITVTVTHGNSMTPSEWDAHQNDVVTVNITSDMDGEVHLHGYDIPFDNKAGVVTTKKFTADKTGDFPIEWESTSTPLGHLVVTP